MEDFADYMDDDSIRNMTGNDEVQQIEGLNMQVADAIRSATENEKVEMYMATANVDKATAIRIISDETFDAMYKDSVSMAMFIDKTNDRKFSSPTTIEDAEKMLMKSSCFAQEETIIVVENIFHIKTINIYPDFRRMEDIQTPTATNRIRKYTSDSFASSIIDTSRNNEKLDKVVFLHYENQIHYNLIVFAGDAGVNNKKRGGGRLTRGRRTCDTGGHDRSSNRTRRNHDNHDTLLQQQQDGGANINPSNRKRGIFFQSTANKALGNNFNKGIDHDLSDIFTNQMKDVQIDRMSKSPPIYILMLLYSKYNRSRRPDSPTKGDSDAMLAYNKELYAKYRPFYIEFRLIDAMINDIPLIIDGKEKSIKFKKLFHHIFGNELHSEEDYLKNMFDNEPQITLLGGGVGGTGLKIPFGSRNTTNYNRNTPTAPPYPLSQSYGMHSLPIGRSLKQSTMQTLTDNKSNLSFQVNVHLTLSPGDDAISMGDKVGFACEASKTEMSRSWSQITGKPYYPTPRSSEVGAYGNKDRDARKAREEKDARDVKEEKDARDARKVRKAREEREERGE
jgi:hypothetical protein